MGVVYISGLASYPVPRPAFRRLQYRTASDEKLGVGLGTRLSQDSSQHLLNSVLSIRTCIQKIMHVIIIMHYVAIMLVYAVQIVHYKLSFFPPDIVLLGRVLWIRVGIWRWHAVETVLGTQTC